MSGERLLMDTNIVLGYLRGDPEETSVVNDRPGAEICVSVITRMELLSYHALSEEEDAIVRRFLNNALVVPLNEEVEGIAIALRRETRRKLPDAIVAATAIWLKAELATADGGLARTKYPGLRIVAVGVD